MKQAKVAGVKVVQLVGFQPFTSQVDRPTVPIAIPAIVMRRSVVVHISKYVSRHADDRQGGAVEGTAKWEGAFQIHTSVGVFEVTQNSYFLAMEDHPEMMPVPPDGETVREIEQER